jgi:hypothetical protein
MQRTEQKSNNEPHYRLLSLYYKRCFAKGVDHCGGYIEFFSPLINEADWFFRHAC